MFLIAGSVPLYQLILLLHSAPPRLTVLALLYCTVLYCIHSNIGIIKLYISLCTILNYCTFDCFLLTVDCIALLTS